LKIKHVKPQLPISKNFPPFDHEGTEGVSLMEKDCDDVHAEKEKHTITAAQREDLRRRIAAYEANPSAGSSWEEVKARLRGQS